MAQKTFVQNNNNMAIAYYRYSSHSQNEASIDQQREQAQQYATANNLLIVKEYVDAAKTGTDDNRPQYQLMLDEVKTIRPAVLILWKTDRLGRNRLDLLMAKTIIRGAGCAIRYVAEPSPDDTPESMLMEGFLESMSEYYSQQLRRNIKRGMYHNAEHCLYNGHATLGYDVDDDKHYIINDKEASIVRRIYQEFINGKPKAVIIRELNDAGFTTKKGKQFNDNGLHRILTNRMYIGEYHYAEVVIPGGVPAIIDEDDFDKAQQRFNLNKHKPKSFDDNDAPRFWLTGKLFCGKCGSQMFGISGTGKHGDKHYYYVCTNQRKHKLCDKKPVRQESIENAVLKGLSQFLKDPALLVILMVQIATYYEEKNKDTSLMDMLEGELKDVNKSLDNLLKAIEQGIITKTTQARMLELEQQQQTLLEGIEREKLKTQVVRKPHLIRRYLEQYQYKNIDDTDTRDMILGTFVDKIYLYDDDKIVITCHFDDKKREYSIEAQESDVRDAIDNILHIDSKTTGVDGFDHRLLGSTTSLTTISQDMVVYL